MSLIQEALKRQQEDEGGEQAAAEPEQVMPQAQQTTEVEVPAQPRALPLKPTMQDEAPEERDGSNPEAADKTPDQDPPETKEESPAKAWLSVMSVLLVLILIISGLSWGATIAFKKWRAQQEVAADSGMQGTAEEPEQPPTKPVGSDVVPQVNPEQPVSTAGSDDPPTGVVAAEPDRTVAEADVTATPPENPVDIPKPFELVEDNGTAGTDVKPQAEPVVVTAAKQPKQTAGTEPAAKPLEQATTVQPTPKPAVQVSTSEPQKPQGPPPVEWPSVTLAGFVGAGNDGTAILNGEFIGVGETIAGVKLVGFYQKSVKLSYKGETQTLKMGQTTE